MKVFISHNKVDKSAARLLASDIVLRGVDVWFDEWSLKPGDSISGGVEDGLTDSDVFVLIWSEEASKSNWVDAEIRAYFGRKMEDPTLGIVPIMLDDTPLPRLIADSKGFKVSKDLSLEDIAAEITGQKTDRELAALLQDRFHEVASNLGAGGGGVESYRVCPECGSIDLEGFGQTDGYDHRYLVVRCKECGWSDADEI